MTLETNRTYHLRLDAKDGVVVSKQATAAPGRRCRCPHPVGDPRIGTCCYCGHQVPGAEMPTRDWKP